MPHFENLDQYEGKDPRSGKNGIVPIAPHSMQATDYRPRKGDSTPARKRRQKPEFPEVEIEPISVEQMEKEFRAAGRGRSGSVFRRRESLWRKFANWLTSLFPEKKKSRSREDRHGGRNRRRGNRKRNGQQSSQQQGKRRRGGDQQGRDQQGRGQQGGRQQKNPNRRKGGNKPVQRDNKNDSNGPQKMQDGEMKPSSGRRRNRRNRRRSGPGTQGGGVQNPSKGSN
jgi:ribonuclease E